MTSILIIGGGVAGLSAGCYSQMNSFQTKILEQHTKPGGVCTSWRRGGYTFDGCIHWLIGSSPSSSYHCLWEELGTLDDRPMIHHDELMRIQESDERPLVVHSDIAAFEDHLLDLAPDDSTVIRELTRVLRLFVSEELPLQEPRELEAGAMQHWPSPVVLRELRKYASVTIEQFASRFTSPFLREMLPRIFDIPEFSMAAVMTTLAAFHKGDGGYPVGGSGAFSRAIEGRYISLGGQIEYGCRVESILVEDGRAIGVRLDDGAELRADVVISAADGRSTIFEMLDGSYGSSFTRRYYEPRRVFPPRTQISLGVDMDLSKGPHDVTQVLGDEPIEAAGVTHDALRVRHFGFDPTMASEGKSVITIGFNTDYEAWRSLCEDRARYEDEKMRTADAVVDFLETRWSGVGAAIEVTDVATPITWERYTGNWRGAYEGWLLNPDAMELVVAGRGLARTLAGLKSFYMVGQWVEVGGGLAAVALSGRQIVQVICQKEGKTFVTA